MRQTVHNVDLYKAELGCSGIKCHGSPICETLHISSAFRLSVWKHWLGRDVRRLTTERLTPKAHDEKVYYARLATPRLRCIGLRTHPLTYRYGDIREWYVELTNRIKAKRKALTLCIVAISLCPSAPEPPSAADQGYQDDEPSTPRRHALRSDAPHHQVGSPPARPGIQTARSKRKTPIRHHSILQVVSELHASISSEAVHRYDNFYVHEAMSHPESPHGSRPTSHRSKTTSRGSPHGPLGERGSRLCLLPGSSAS